LLKSLTEADVYQIVTMNSMPLTSNVRQASPQSQLLDAFERRGGVLTRQDLRTLGVAPRTLRSALADGVVVRIAHGLYRLPQAAPFGTAAFAQACLAIPKSVVALQSALSHYELTTQIVDEVEIAVPRNTTRKKVEIPLRIVPMPLSRFTWAIESVRTDTGDRFRIFTPERTVCDCFAYPKIVDETVAYEGLRNYLDRSMANLELLMKQAEFTGTVDIIGPVVKARLT